MVNLFIIGRVFVDLSNFLVMNEKYFLKRKKKEQREIFIFYTNLPKTEIIFSFLNLGFRLSNFRFPVMVCVLISI